MNGRYANFLNRKYNYQLFTNPIPKKWYMYRFSGMAPAPFRPKAKNAYLCGL